MPSYKHKSNSYVWSWVDLWIVIATITVVMVLLTGIRNAVAVDYSDLPGINTDDVSLNRAGAAASLVSGDMVYSDLPGTTLENESLSLNREGAVFALKNRDIIYSSLPGMKPETESTSLNREGAAASLQSGDTIYSNLPGVIYIYIEVDELSPEQAETEIVEFVTPFGQVFDILLPFVEKYHHSKMLVPVLRMKTHHQRLQK